jgi:hypothetical protein
LTKTEARSKHKLCNHFLVAKSQPGIIMGKKQKLWKRLRSNPKDFRWSELTTLFNQLGYKQIEGSGSRVKFYRESPRDLISIHRPHPGEILKPYQVKDIVQKLEENINGDN